MRRAENEPAWVPPRKGRSEWCVLSLCTEQGPRGCFNILLNVMFLLTLAGEIFSPERLLPARLLAKFLWLLREKGHSPPHTTWAAPDSWVTGPGYRGRHPQEGTLPRAAPARQADRQL